MREVDAIGLLSTALFTGASIFLGSHDLVLGIAGFITFRLVGRRYPAFGWVILGVTASAIGYVLVRMWRFERGHRRALVTQLPDSEEARNTRFCYLIG